jgi:hypothetical protein
MEKKRIAAAELLEEKERAIKRGLKSKIANLEGEAADTMLKKALELDVDEEIALRYEKVKQKINIEDSANLLESARSNLTTSQDKASKKKQNVHFAPTVYVGKLQEQSATKLPISDDDSIAESI